MILRIECTSCNHVGLVCAETLPRSLTCSRCGESRRVEVRDGRRMVSTAAILELLAGGAEAQTAK
jgi:transcription elongation factor Elf1